MLQKNATKIINSAPLFFLIIVKLSKREFILRFFEYKISVPTTTVPIPMYWSVLSFSSRSKKEKKELKSGVSERRGIVKLKSEWIIDFKKSIAEITLIMTKIEPGNIYFASKEKFFSKQVHKKKKITCTIIKIDSNIFGLKYFNDNFLVTSKNAQKKPFNMQSNRLIKSKI